MRLFAPIMILYSCAFWERTVSRTRCQRCRRRRHYRRRDLHSFLRIRRRDYVSAHVCCVTGAGHLVLDGGYNINYNHRQKPETPFRSCPDVKITPRSMRYRLKSPEEC